MRRQREVKRFRQEGKGEREVDQGKYWIIGQMLETFERYL